MNGRLAWATARGIEGRRGVRIDRVQTFSALLLAALCCGLPAPSLAAGSPPTAYVTTVLSDGAGPYYRLGESDGTVALDASALGENGTYTSGGIAYGAPSLLFADGDSSVFADAGFGTPAGVVAPASSDPSDYSIEGWFQPVRSGSVPQALIVRVNGDGAWTQMLTIQGGHFVHFVASPPATEYSVRGATTIELGGTYHVVGTFTANGEMRLYVNGVEDGVAVSVGPPTHGDHWQVGLAPSISGQQGWDNFDGLMDDIAFYGYVLTPDQILNHYRLATGQPSVTFP